MTNITEYALRADFDNYLVPSYSPASYIPVKGLDARVWDQRPECPEGGHFQEDLRGHHRAQGLETLEE